MIDFCPNCNSVLISQSDEDTHKLVLKCINCDYVRNVTENRTLKRTVIAKDINRESLNASMLYDRALKYSTWIKCPNDKCPTTDKPRWHTVLPETDLKVFPTVMITNFTNVDKIATYICKTCNTAFTAGPKTSN